MKKSEIKVSGHYLAKVSGKLVMVRVDAIREIDYQVKTRGPNIPAKTHYDVTNIATGRKATFRSAAKFRSKAKPNTVRVSPEQVAPPAILAEHVREHSVHYIGKEVIRHVEDVCWRSKVQRLEHRGAGHAGNEGDVDHRERDRGQQQVAKPRPDAASSDNGKLCRPRDKECLREAHAMTEPARAQDEVERLDGIRKRLAKLRATLDGGHVMDNDDGRTVFAMAESLANIEKGNAVTSAINKVLNG